jgi:hypothetical protein
MSALVLMVGFAASTMLSKAQDASGAPHLRKPGAATQLIVDGITDKGKAPVANL